MSIPTPVLWCGGGKRRGFVMGHGAGLSHDVVSSELCGVCVCVGTIVCSLFVVGSVLPITPKKYFNFLNQVAVAIDHYKKVRLVEIN